MKESFLHYVWQNKLFVNTNLLTTDGQRVELVDVGRLNGDSGPDFFNAKVKIDDTLWAGNIEIHVNASDWNRHNHSVDKVYDSVILHVVRVADATIYRTDGEKIPQLIVQYPASLEDDYKKLMLEQKWIPCADRLFEVPSIYISSWKNTMLTERLRQKTEHIQSLLKEYSQHWEEAFYISLARSFGFNTNSQVFELLAKSVSLSVLTKHKNDLFQLEAILFGQSGLLYLAKPDDYVTALMKEYDFLKKKYGLVALDGTQWKLLRMRPDNFPHLRIAQFAALIHSSSKLFSKIIEKPELKYLTSLFVVETSEYWKSHYLFSEVSAVKIKALGRNSINSIVINTIVPLLFCYAIRNGNDELKEKTLDLLEKIPAEKNLIVTAWEKLGIEIKSAYDSQAFLHLKKIYCDHKKCLRCRIGHKVLTRKLEVRS